MNSNLLDSGNLYEALGFHNELLLGHTNTNELHCKTDSCICQLILSAQYWPFTAISVYIGIGIYTIQYVPI